MKRIQILLSSAAMLPMLVMTPSTVFAVTNTATETTTNTQQKPKTDAPATKETTEQRITKYKKEYALQVSVAEQTKLKAKCKVAQAKGKVLASTVVERNTARTLVYKDIVAKLDDIIARLKDADYNTKDLDAQRTELQKLITTYGTDLTAYTNTLTDLTTVDCVTDPVGFKASLEVARESRAAVNKDAVAIRTYIETTIKKSLKEASSSLSSTSKPATQDSTRPETNEEVSQ